MYFHPSLFPLLLLFFNESGHFVLVAVAALSIHPSIIPSMRLSKMTTKILSIERLGSGPAMQTKSPFLFAVYHKDHYPPGNAAMEAPHRGNGMDFDPEADYRMYHGSKIPGFPQHPHRGFETIVSSQAVTRFRIQGRYVCKAHLAQFCFAARHRLPPLTV